MKSSDSPLLFLGACRIHIALEANHRESPCGRGAEGTTQGARPSEEGWDRSQCRYKAQALWSHPAPLRFRYGSLRSHYSSFTVPLRFLYGSLRPITPLLRPRAYTRRNPADNDIQSKAAPPPRGKAGKRPPACACIAVPRSRLVQRFPRHTSQGRCSRRGQRESSLTFSRSWRPLSNSRCSLRLVRQHGKEVHGTASRTVQATHCASRCGGSPGTAPTQWFRRRNQPTWSSSASCRPSA